MIDHDRDALPARYTNQSDRTPLNMITGQLRSKVDKLWEEFWTGGITNPLTVIEQISYLMFARLLDMRESTEEKKWSRKNKTKKFPGVYFPRDKQHIRWQNLKQEADGDEVLRIVRDELFPHFRTLGSADAKSDDGPSNTFGQYMKDDTLMVNKPSLLVKAITMVDELPLTQGDTKGDLYEYLLSKLTTAGINGQFRTPRHVIRAMVDVILHDNYEEALSWTVGDPACGTVAFSWSSCRLCANTSHRKTVSSARRCHSKTRTASPLVSSAKRNTTRAT